MNGGSHSLENSILLRITTLVDLHYITGGTAHCMPCTLKALWGVSLSRKSTDFLPRSALRGVMRMLRYQLPPKATKKPPKTQQIIKIKQKMLCQRVRSGSCVLAEVVWLSVSSKMPCRSSEMPNYECSQWRNPVLLLMTSLGNSNKIVLADKK